VNYSDFAIFSTTIILLTLLIDDCGKKLTFLNVINSKKSIVTIIGAGIGNTFLKQYWYWYRQ